MQAEREYIPDEDSDDDFDWEEVVVPPFNTQEPEADAATEPTAGPSVSSAHIEITIHARPKKDESEKLRRAALQAERANRLNCHKAHTVILLGNASVRNKWINDPLLHARLMSLVPMKLQNGFIIHKSRVPEAAMRGRMFESAVVHLVDWWCKIFDVLPYGHIKSRTYEEVQKEILEKIARQNDRKGKRRARDDDEDMEDDYGDGEVVRSEKSLMKHALQRRGCRDTSAQLFTALCRALGIPARLVVSLQSVPWQKDGGKPKPHNSSKKSNKKGKNVAEVNLSDTEEDMEEVDIPSSPATNGKGKEKEKIFQGTGQRLDGVSSPEKAGGKQKAPPVIRLRRSKGRKLGSAPVVKRERSPDPLDSTPVFWTEVFSRADARWLPVDPVRGIVNKRKIFDPTYPPNHSPNTRIRNRMVYVLAFEEDGHARDVTARYATEYGAKVSKLQQGGKGKKEWWERVMALVRRPYRLNRDDLEDEELHVNQMTEQMPTTMTGFKDHPLYVLARHLKREEVIHPPVELGKFRGEPVYPRSSVVSLKTAENWMRQGRKVREGCQPMKWVKQRAVTVNKKRAIEMALSERQDRAGERDQGEGFSSEKDIMQGLYALNQTELYVPDPVVDGKVPKNEFGNIDLYVPSMLPPGGVHIPHKGVWKIARQLGFDYAEAVTGFEFRKRRALPVITGIVAAKENEEALLEAYWTAEQDAEEKRKAKRQEQVIKRWQRLVHGLRIRQRLQEQYADRVPPERTEVTVQVEQDSQDAGGFVSTADTVVQHYVLPKNLHEVPRSPRPATVDEDTHAPDDGTRSDHDRDLLLPEIEAPLNLVMEEGDDMEEIPVDATGPSGTTTNSTAPSTPAGAPKTMRELAEDATLWQASLAVEEEAEELPLASSKEAPSPSTRTRGRTRAGTNNAAGTSAGASTAPPKRGTPKTTTTTMKATRGRRQRRSNGRKRARDEDTESDSEVDVDVDGGVDAADETQAQTAETAAGPPAKRPRRGRGKATAAPIPKSDRVLRTRAPKSAAAMQAGSH